MEPATQVLILALVKPAGGGWFTVGVVILLLLAFPFPNGRKWAVYALPGVILVFYLPNLWATLLVLQHTPGTPPLAGERRRMSVSSCRNCALSEAAGTTVLIDRFAPSIQHAVCGNR